MKINTVFIVVASVSGSSESSKLKNYASSLQRKIFDVAQQKPIGWIVDVRGNAGGNMWPMIVGVGPLIGANTLGFFVYPMINIPWYYDRGESGVINIKGKCANFKLDSSIADLPNMPVVVLIDGATASSAEALAISFKGRSNTCFMGQQTSGLSTCNEAIKLPDGATLVLTTAGEADRNCVSYESGIAPDVEIVQGQIPLGGSNDPGIKAAIYWLNNHAAQP